MSKTGTRDTDTPTMSEGKPQASIHRTDWLMDRSCSQSKGSKKTKTGSRKENMTQGDIIYKIK